MRQISLKHKTTKADTKTIEASRGTSREANSLDKERIETEKEEGNGKRLKESSFTVYGDAVL